MIEWLIGIYGVSTVLVLLMVARAPELEEPAKYRSRQAMPDGSRDVEANNDAAQNVHARSATRIDPTGRGGSNP